MARQWCAQWWKVIMGCLLVVLMGCGLLAQRRLSEGVETYLHHPFVTNDVPVAVTQAKPVARLPSRAALLVWRCLAWTWCTTNETMCLNMRSWKAGVRICRRARPRVRVDATRAPRERVRMRCVGLPMR